ncbi:hypothetical protein CLV98_1344 [Dyadobacter jejuensis]|uniref:Uncharacterized protein n=1 Tax=Dyadobacter jejuensis TaxID=1082580 RepID=A0A316A5W8_9BACT|nr:hypothetical protein CLV98_1344 [Dyadobacter jejuensis]
MTSDKEAILFSIIEDRISIYSGIWSPFTPFIIQFYFNFQIAFYLLHTWLVKPSVRGCYPNKGGKWPGVLEREGLVDSVKLDDESKNLYSILYLMVYLLSNTVVNLCFVLIIKFNNKNKFY